MHFSAVQDVILKNDSTWTSFHRQSLTMAARGIDVFLLIQLHKPYTVGKLSISWAKIGISARYDLRSKNNSFRKGKIQGEIAKKLQKGQVIWPNVFQTNGRSGLLEESLAYLQKGRHENLSEKAGFMFSYVQLERSAKGDLSSSLESNRVSSGKMKKERE